MNRISRVLALAGLALGSVAAMTAPVSKASGQAVALSFGGGGERANSVRSAAVPGYCKILGLDESQTEAFKTLHASYKERMQESRKAMNEAFKGANDAAQDGDFKAMGKKIREVAEKYGSEQSKMTDELLKDLKGLLHATQADKWADLERMRRRETMGEGMGIVSGASVDLIDMVEKLSLPAEESTKVAPVLAEYDLDMDRQLRDRGDVQRKMGEEEKKNQKEEDGFNFDMESMEKMMSKMRELDLKQLDINTRFLERLSSNLSADWKQKLESKWRESAFRRIYGETHAQRQLRAAAKFEGLTTEQLAKIEDIKKSFETDAAVLNEAWMKAQIASDKEGKSGVMGMVHMGDDSGDDPLSKARKARKDREKKASDDLKALLSEEQRAKLPKRPKNSIMGPGGEEFEIGEGFEYESDDGSERVIIRTGGGGL